MQKLERRNILHRKRKQRKPLRIYLFSLYFHMFPCKTSNITSFPLRSFQYFRGKVLFTIKRNMLKNLEISFLIFTIASKKLLITNTYHHYVFV